MDDMEITMQRMISLTLVLGLALATTAQAKSEKASVKLDGSDPQPLRIRVDAVR